MRNQNRMTLSIPESGAYSYSIFREIVSANASIAQKSDSQFIVDIVLDSLLPKSEEAKRFAYGFYDGTLTLRDAISWVFSSLENVPEAEERIDIRNLVEFLHRLSLRWPLSIDLYAERGLRAKKALRLIAEHAETFAAEAKLPKSKELALRLFWDSIADQRTSGDIQVSEVSSFILAFWDELKDFDYTYFLLEIVITNCVGWQHRRQPTDSGYCFDDEQERLRLCQEFLNIVDNVFLQEYCAGKQGD